MTRSGGLEPSAGRVGLVAVAVLASAFGVTLVEVVGVLDTALHADPTTGHSMTVRVLAVLAAVVFGVIALYVSGIVTANTVETVVSGRRRSIALRRLIGSSAANERRQLTREALLVGSIGALGGALGGVGVSVTTARVAVATGLIANTHYSYTPIALPLPIAAVIAMTWFSARRGTRRVLEVRPIEALGNSVDPVSADSPNRSRRLALVLIAVGAGLLGAAVALGQVTPIAVLIGIPGGVVSSIGVLIGAELVVPPLLSALGRVVAFSPSGQIARAYATQRPERSTRLTSGLLVAVTLVTTFIVAIDSYQSILDSARKSDPVYYRGTQTMIHATTTVFTALIAFSALIAAVGLINNLLVDVRQREREFGLLRAVGMTRRQLSMSLLIEAGLLTVTSTSGGLLLGVVYGWCGAQSLIGSVTGSPGFVIPTLSINYIAAALLAAAIVTMAATVAPARTATRVPPVLAIGAP